MDADICGRTTDAKDPAGVETGVGRRVLAEIWEMIIDSANCETPEEELDATMLDIGEILADTKT